MWSVTTRRETSDSCESPYSTPVSSVAFLMTAMEVSISYMFCTPCRIIARRSRPRPVSMFLLGSSPRISKSSLPMPSPRSYCMKTRFQISTYRSSLTAGPPSTPNSGPRS